MPAFPLFERRNRFDMKSLCDNSHPASTVKKAAGMRSARIVVASLSLVFVIVRATREEALDESAEKNLFEDERRAADEEEEEEDDNAIMLSKVNVNQSKAKQLAQRMRCHDLL